MCTHAYIKTNIARFFIIYFFFILYLHTELFTECYKEIKRKETDFLMIIEIDFFTHFTFSPAAEVKN